MDPQLAALQAQLASIQNTAPIAPIIPLQPIPSKEVDNVESLKQMIREEVEKAIKGVGSPTKTYTLIEAIEEVLSTSDQTFLANLTVINALPAWIVNEGRDITQQFVKDFRTSYES